ncbi:PAS domain S-box-containing protein [Caulobacter ginsengisoli]|uniref:histidine kinase n=1 Tax=Caulobacter ginsengisoli TaxID=400775 RepID=A0ABU0IXN4_9CAUL|nr:HWE histidine kinase domain-containing protein [Caulobacter ginsengisoli]MDQ0466762.1 PAS domain S-box-containing protein [Caulobacter ginsengisoli]
MSERLAIWKRWKVGPGLVIAMAVGLLLAGLSMAIYNEYLTSGQKLRALTVQAEILSGSVSAALAFDDREAAREYVSALSANRDVEAVGVYDLQGRLVAGFAKGGSRLPAINQVRPPAWNGDRLTVTATVAQKSEVLGSVYLRTVREPLVRRIARYGGIALLIIMASLLLIVLGVSNNSLALAHRSLGIEMDERGKAEAALRRSQEQEAAAQLTLATERGQAALRQSQQQLEFALQAGRLGSWELDLTTRKLAASEFFRANFGLGPDDPLDRYDELFARVYPDDRDALAQAINKAIAEASELEAEHRTLTPTGEIRWILVRGRAVYDEAGTPVRLAGVSLDITGRKMAEDRQRALLDELNHRVKNTLATVQAVAMQTSRTKSAGTSFESAFLARIGALARAHDLLTEVAWEGASLTRVISRTLEPYVAQGQLDRISLTGPEVRLGPNAAVTLTMAFHELATNAGKYGSFSAVAGQVSVDWRVDSASSPPALEIDWREMGGPAVAPPSRRGFGSRFIEKGLAREFDGEVHLTFSPEGVCCRMRLPLSTKLRLAA